MVPCPMLKLTYLPCEIVADSSLLEESVGSSSHYLPASSVVHSWETLSHRALGSLCSWLESCASRWHSREPLHCTLTPEVFPSSLSLSLSTHNMSSISTCPSLPSLSRRHSNASREFLPFLSVPRTALVRTSWINLISFNKPIGTSKKAGTQPVSLHFLQWPGQGLGPKL